MQRALLAGVVVSLALSACGDDDASAIHDAGFQATPDDGVTADRGAASIDAGQTASLDAAVESFQLLYSELIAPRCQECHGTVDGGRTSAKLALVPRDVALAQIINMPALGRSCADAGFPLVVPGEPDRSLFLLKLEPDPRCGTRMPRALDGGAIPAFSEEEIARVRRWIEQGALDN